MSKNDQIEVVGHNFLNALHMLFHWFNSWRAFIGLHFDETEKRVS